MNRIRRLPPLFWIGLLPVVILLWAWADSTRHITAWLRCTEDDRWLNLVVRDSAMEFVSTVLNDPSPQQLEKFKRGQPVRSGLLGRIDRRPWTNRQASWFPQPAKSERSPLWWTGIGDKILIRTKIVPFWMVLAAYLPLWLGISWWQARRRRKRIEMDAPEG